MPLRGTVQALGVKAMQNLSFNSLILCCSHPDWESIFEIVGPAIETPLQKVDSNPSASPGRSGNMAWLPCAIQWAIHICQVWLGWTECPETRNGQFRFMGLRGSIWQLILCNSVAHRLATSKPGLVGILSNSHPNIYAATRHAEQTHQNPMWQPSNGGYYQFLEIPQWIDNETSAGLCLTLPKQQHLVPCSVRTWPVECGWRCTQQGQVPVVQTDVSRQVRIQQSHSFTPNAAKLANTVVEITKASLAISSQIAYARTWSLFDELSISIQLPAQLKLLPLSTNVILGHWSSNAFKQYLRVSALQSIWVRKFKYNNASPRVESSVSQLGESEGVLDWMHI